MKKTKLNCLSRALLCILFFCGFSQTFAKNTKDLLSEEHWRAYIGKGNIDLTRKGNGSLLIKVDAEDGGESFPNLKLPINKEDWQGYTTLKARIRISSDSELFDRKRVNFICYSDDYRRAGLESNPHHQQGIDAVWLKKNLWSDIEIDMKEVYRSNIVGLDIYIYKNPPVLAHNFEIEIEELMLTGPSDDVFFASFGYPETICDENNFYSDNTIRLGKDGFFEIDNTGSVRIKNDGKTLENSSNFPSGWLVLNHSTGKLEKLSGKIFGQSGSILQNGFLGSSNLKYGIEYKAEKDSVRLKGNFSVEDGEQLLTIYYVLPVGGGEWIWGQDITKEINSKTEPTDYEYVNTRNPMSSLTLQDEIGLGLGVPTNKPVVFQTGYNRKQGIYYIAFDVALTNKLDVPNKKHNSCELDFTVYKYQPQWGFRACVDKYYRLFASEEELRVVFGGWGLSRANIDPEPCSESAPAALNLSWGPDTQYYQWNKDHSIYNILYIEPEFQQISMGERDFATRSDVMERLEKLARADEEEIEICSQLYYFNTHYTAHMTTGGLEKWGQPLGGFMQALAKSTIASVMESKFGYETFDIEKREWIRDSGIGAMFACNISPDIPDGKGWLNTNIALKYQIADVQDETGVKIDGLGLDCLMWADEFDCRIRNIKYSRHTLSHCNANGKRKIALPQSFGTLEWLQSLRQNPEYKDMIMMANLGGAKLRFLPFVASELDVLGIEGTHIPDPEFLRTIAYRKTVTDLHHYGTPPRWKTKFNLLYGICPGYGHEKELLIKYAPILKKMLAGGWQPITALRADNELIRIERYGDAELLYFAIHNASRSDKISFECEIENSIGSRIIYATNMEDGSPLRHNETSFKMELGSLDTTVVELLLN